MLDLFHRHYAVQSRQAADDVLRIQLVPVDSDAHRHDGHRIHRDVLVDGQDVGPQLIEEF